MALGAAFALADHQLAHVYTKGGDAQTAARAVLEDLPGVEAVAMGPERSDWHLDHPNAGDLVAVAEPDAWFTYYYWSDGAHEPDFARTVDIHRKPGYDPCEMFADPALRLPALRVARRLAQKKLGMRYLMDVVPLDASLIGGSHGRLPARPERGPVWIASEPWSTGSPEPASGVVGATSVRDRLLGLLGLAEA